MRAVYIMWLRQLKRYYRTKSRIVGALGQPLLFLIALGFGLGPVFEKAGQGNFIQFLAPGIIAMTILFTAMFAGLEVIWDRQFGFLKETLVAPVSRKEIMLGKTLGGATVAIFQGILVFFISLLIGFKPNFSGFLLAVVFMFAIAFMFSTLGVLIASKMEDMQAFPLVINFMIMPLFFLSGAVFPLEGIPKILEIVTKFNPLTYGVDGLRYALTGQGHYNPVLGFFVLVVISVIFFFIGSYFFSKIEV